MLNGTLSFLQKYFSFCWAFSFVLFTVHVVKNVQVTSKLPPKNHFITKHILFLKQFHQFSWFVNTLHMVCSKDITMPTKLIKKTCRNHFLKHFLFSWNFRPPPLSTRHISRVRRNFENILLAGSCHWIHLLHWYYMHHTRSSKAAIWESEK